MTTRSGLVVLLLSLAVVVATAPVGAVPADAGAAPPVAVQNDTNTTNESLGASISSFMQASAADAEGEVDDGMFSARFESADAQRRDELVRDRAGDLEARLESLREQRADLLNGTNASAVARQAKAARLTARINALQEAINTTDSAAERANVNLTVLQELRRNASELGGPQVAALAGSLVTERGPPEDRGPGAAGNGPPANRSDGNSTERGPPEDSGQGDAGTTDGTGDAGTDESSANDGADGSGAETDGSGSNTSESG